MHEEATPTIDAVAEWLMEQALRDGSIRDIFVGCCARLVATGMPLARAFLCFRTLHPLYSSVYLVWHRHDNKVQIREQPHDEAFRNDVWLRSPMHHMLQSGIPYLRRRLAGPEAVTDFEWLDTLRDEGITDFVGYLVPFSTEEQPDGAFDGIFGSWSTDRESGFSRLELRELARVQTRLAVAAKVQIRREITENVLSAYLGNDAGRQVLEGRIRRGDGRRVQAVIWFSDLRRSTRLAEELPDDVYLDLLNRYFECTAGAVLEAGGEVLRFIGDAVLAIFPLDGKGGDGTASAAQALGAARAAVERIRALNAAPEAPARIGFGIGLHVGELMFGNIGVPQRVEFSVIGAAANEVARLEDLTKEVGRTILVSGALAALAPDTGWQSLGEHPLRGVGNSMAVFAPDWSG